MNKYFKEILAIESLFFVTIVMVWIGCRQQQRTPKPAGTALQTSFPELLNGRVYHLKSDLFPPDEDRQQMREVSFECFLLLSLFLLITLPNFIKPAVYLTPIHPPMKFKLVSTANFSSYVTVIR